MDRTAKGIKAEIDECRSKVAYIYRNLSEGRYQDWDNKTIRQLEDHMTDLEWQLEQIQLIPIDTTTTGAKQ